MEYDVIVVGAGLAGLVTATELADAGKHVLLLEQEGEQSIGGQAWWSFGGLFLVDSPEQRRMGVKDTRDLAWQNWLGTAGFDRQHDEDYWAMKWAAHYVDFATEEKRAWLHEKGVSLFPVVGWAERGGHLADGHGNSVPRFHITWGTGPGLVAPFAKSLRHHVEKGTITFMPRHQVNALHQADDHFVGLSGSILAQSHNKRGQESNRDVVGEFFYKGAALVIASGGIGGNLELVKENWPSRLGEMPTSMISGVPKHVDGRMLAITENIDGRIVNRDRMWHYTEGIKNWNPIWPNHGIRILPGPSSLWFDAEGNRFEAPNFPGFDTLSTLEAIMKTGYDYSWFILTEKVIEKEFALSGSEQNPDLTEKSIGQVLGRVLPGPPAPIKRFLQYGEDFVMADNIEALVGKMNRLTGTSLLASDKVREQIIARDREIKNTYAKDLQVTAMYGARNYLGDKLIRTAKPHPFLTGNNGKLIAVRLHILSRKTLGGLQTDLQARVLDTSGKALSGVYAVGEVAGFGGGGIHGYRSLEGTFLGACLYTGKRAAAGVLDYLR